MQRRQQKGRGRKSPPPPPAKSVTARIDHIGARGDGVATFDGDKIFAPLTAPGDLVRMIVRGERGEIESLIEESPYRAPPPCAHYGACGGCALQHVTPAFYRDWKRQLVVEALAREGFDADIVAPLVACASASRRRASFAVRRTAAGAVIGFNARASAQIVSIDSCPVLAPPLNALLPAFRALVDAAPARWRAFDLAATLCDNGADVSFIGGDAGDDLSGPEIMALADAARSAGDGAETRIVRVSVAGATVAGFETPVVRFAGAPVALPAGSFLQASAQGEAALTALVVKHVSKAKRVADLFSGCGTFSLPLAASAAVDAFDSDAPAIDALGAAARAAGLRHPLRAERRNLFDRPLSVADLKPYDAVVFDPPRAGARAQAEQLAVSAVPRVVGVSCNPVSFARDAAILCAGGYSLSQVAAVDQFVYSPHVELVGMFIRS